MLLIGILNATLIALFWYQFVSNSAIRIDSCHPLPVVESELAPSWTPLQTLTNDLGILYVCTSNKSQQLGHTRILGLNP